YAYKCLIVSDLGDGIFHVQMNRPNKMNALDMIIWNEIGDVFTKLDTDENCRAVILSGNGKAFSTGIDLSAFSQTLQQDDKLDTARKSRKLLRMVEEMQLSFTKIEKCCKPVIAAIHGYCIGGGIDIMTACDIRYSTKDTDFSVKEVAVGLAADVGSLNRLPKIVGNHSWLRDVSLTARHFGAAEASQYGLISRVFDSYDQVFAAAKETAKSIATSSPVAVQGTKIVLNYARDHPVDDSLKFVAMWNMSQ
ncbi:hypothetical protein PFISCL1PPCAC_4957, partial [Pristionchus fissidentatus]